MNYCPLNLRDSIPSESAETQPLPPLLLSFENPSKAIFNIKASKQNFILNFDSMLLFRYPKRKPCSVIFFTAHQSTHDCLCSSSSPQNSDLKPPNFNFDEYLANSWGFSPDKAARYSKYLAHLKSPQNPDSVMFFLKHQGFSEADIKTLISKRPAILCSSPEKTLDPNLCALRGMGFSSYSLVKILLSSPAALQYTSAVKILLSSPAALQYTSAAPRIKFWLDFFDGVVEDIIKAFNLNRALITLDIGNNIEPKISLLQSHGLSTQDIRRMVLAIPRFLTSSPCSMKNNLNRTKELGFQTQSPMFLHGLKAMVSIPTEALQKKMELLKSFGWSEDEFLSALREDPAFVLLSVKNMRGKMEFLIGEAGCDPSYIASRPRLLHYSLEKRLRPRNHILRLLELKGLFDKRRSFYNAIAVINKDFVDKYILLNKEEISGLHEAYLSACASGSK